VLVLDDEGEALNELLSQNDVGYALSIVNELYFMEIYHANCFKDANTINLDEV
jgi:hypothetical protein